MFDLIGKHYYLNIFFSSVVTVSHAYLPFLLAGIAQLLVCKTIPLGSAS